MKINQYKITRRVHDIDTLGGPTYNIGKDLPELLLEDGSILVFGGNIIYTMLISDSDFSDGGDNIDEDFLELYTVITNDVDPDTVRYENKGVTTIEIIEIPMKERAKKQNIELESTQLIRIYTEE